jgi:chromosome segregation ATPase
VESLEAEIENMGSGVGDADAANKESMERIHELEAQVAEFEDTSAKLAKQMSSLESELEDAKRNAERASASDEGASGDSSWVETFYGEVNDAISEWRNDSRTLQSQVMDLIDEQYIGEAEHKALMNEISQTADGISEQSEALKKLLRSYRSHID